MSRFWPTVKYVLNESILMTNLLTKLYTCLTQYSPVIHVNSKYLVLLNGIADDVR